VTGDAAAAQITRELVEAEVAAGFPRLGRVPSSTVRHFLDYYRELSAADAATMRAALADRGALALRPARDAALSPELDPAYQRWTNAKIAAGFERSAGYQPLRLAKNIVGAGLAGESNLDRETAKELVETKAATAAQLRKLIKPVFSDRFGLVGRNERGGNWTYEREDRSLKVRIDFGGRSDQLRYSVTATDSASGGRVAMATYEGLLGLFGGWDWIVEEETAGAVDLLAELVGVIESLPQKLGPDTGPRYPAG
jgi:hypothetical protein